ncbi:hypothetical protein CQW23_14454 [Capsicum baccatum]|uniref:E3 ubiquitin ligase UBR4 C-terminal domain-containing protein n=1 Tax=Capsicum baccatum TaxID=33114 RepID=A0A2G2WJ71_CAPBA|nr:hypothetical protein CQW23_14454 [Capsicum baccatum]
MAPFEELYGRKCRSPTRWYEVGDVKPLCTNLVKEAQEKVSSRPRASENCTKRKSPGLEELCKVGTSGSQETPLVISAVDFGFKDTNLPLLTDVALRDVRIAPGPRLFTLDRIQRDPELRKRCLREIFYWVIEFNKNVGFKNESSYPALVQKLYEDNMKDVTTAQQAAKQKCTLENFVRESEIPQEKFLWREVGFKSTVEWTSGLKLLSMLRSLLMGHLATQKCIDEGIILPLLHALEGVLCENEISVGSLEGQVGREKEGYGVKLGTGDTRSPGSSGKGGSLGRGGIKTPCGS